MRRSTDRHRLGSCPISASACRQTHGLVHQTRGSLSSQSIASSFRGGRPGATHLASSLEKMVEENLNVVRVDNGDWRSHVRSPRPHCFHCPGCRQPACCLRCLTPRISCGISDTPSEFMAFVTSGRRLYTHDLKSQLTMVKFKRVRHYEPADVQMMILCGILSDRSAKITHWQDSRAPWHRSYLPFRLCLKYS